MIFEEILLVVLVVLVVMFFSKCFLLVLALDLYHYSHITPLNSVFIKFDHQICHGNTDLGQMSLFLMSNWSQFVSFYDISYYDIINESSFNCFFAWQVRHVHVSPIRMQNSEKNNQIWYNHHFYLSYQIHDSWRVIPTTYYIITPQIHLHPSDNLSLYFPT